MALLEPRPVLMLSDTNILICLTLLLKVNATSQSCTEVNSSSKEVQCSSLYHLEIDITDCLSLEMDKGGVK